MKLICLLTLMITSGKYATRVQKLMYLSLWGLPAFLCTVLLLFGPGFSAPLTIWRGYLILLVDGEAELRPVLDSLRASGIEYVSDRNTRVFLNVFSNTEVVPLSSLVNRLDPADPRYDPYMSALPGYFNARYAAESWYVVYVKSTGTQAGLALSVSKCLKALGIEYRLPEWRPVWFFAGPAAAFGFLFLLVRGRRRSRELVFISTPLFILAAKSSGLGLAASFMLIPGWLYLGDFLMVLLDGFLYERKLVPDRRSLLTGLALVAAGVTCAYLLSFFHVDPPRYCGALSLTLGALVAWAAMMCGGLLLKAAVSYHRIFNGISLLRGTGFKVRGQLGFMNVMLKALLVSVIVISPALTVLSRVDRGLAVAEPDHTHPGRELTLERLAQLAQNPAGGTLPDLSDYVVHRAYQDSLLYEQEWIYPGQDSGVNLSSYRAEDGRIVEEHKRVLSFDSQWFADVIADAADDGLGGMLLAQGGDAAVSLRSTDGQRVQRALKLLAMCALIIVPLAYMLPSLTTYYIYGMRNSPLRRKRQTA
ncbi:MAG: hypothetical protein JW852_04740 [Spirochaetales bacterium]|nr:hypothetical protein [Spirochaetales bacterium]